MHKSVEGEKRCIFASCVRCYRWVLTLAINSSEETVHTLTFSFHSYLSVSHPHTLTLPQSLINSPALSCWFNLSLSLSHTYTQKYLIFVLPLSAYPYLFAQTHSHFSHSFLYHTLMPSLSLLSLFCCPPSVPQSHPSALKGQCVWLTLSYGGHVNNFLS